MKNNPYKNNGASKKWKYEGIKKTTSIRLSDKEKELILTHFDSTQHFIQTNLEKLSRRDPDED